jgi:hypothetical protein
VSNGSLLLPTRNGSAGEPQTASQTLPDEPQAIRGLGIEVLDSPRLISFTAQRFSDAGYAFQNWFYKLADYFEVPNRRPLKLDLLKGAHFVRDLVLQNNNSGSGGTGRYQLENQSTNYLRLMLPVSTRQSIRPFKAVESFNSQLPILTGSRSGDLHTPLSAFVAECVLDTRNNFSA